MYNPVHSSSHLSVRLFPGSTPFYLLHGTCGGRGLGVTYFYVADERF